MRDMEDNMNQHNQHTGSIYLICLDEPYKHVKHYIGFSTNGVTNRLNAHRKGHGSKLLRHVNNHHISYRITRVWSNVTRHDERKLKKQRNAKRFCPRCNPNAYNAKGGVKQGEDK